MKIISSKLTVALSVAASLAFGAPARSQTETLPHDAPAAGEVFFGFVNDRDATTKEIVASTQCFKEANGTLSAHVDTAYHKIPLDPQQKIKLRVVVTGVEAAFQGVASLVGQNGKEYYRFDVDSAHAVDRALIPGTDSAVTQYSTAGSRALKRCAILAAS